MEGSKDSKGLANVPAYITPYNPADLRSFENYIHRNRLCYRVEGKWYPHCNTCRIPCGQGVSEAVQALLRAWPREPSTAWAIDRAVRAIAHTAHVIGHVEGVFDRWTILAEIDKTAPPTRYGQSQQL